MPNGVPGPNVAPLPMETEFISSNERAVMFVNFAVNHSELRKAHDDYIRNILVPHYINQIEALGFFDKVMTLRPVGKASATGPQHNNEVLSAGRAMSVGAAVKRYFDAQKSRGAIAKTVEVKIEPVAEGDRDERQLLGPMVNKIPQKLLEERSNNFRAVLLSLQVRHVVDENDLKIFCRQILNAKVEVVKVPANQLEQKIDEMQKKMPPELKAALKEFFDAAKGLVKTVVEELMKAAEFSAPEIFIIFKGIEFIIPSDIGLMFEFKDSRARLKRYTFTGSANKIDVDALELFCQLLSILKWMTKLPKALEEMEKEVEEIGKKLNATHQQIDALKGAIDKAKKAAGTAKKIFDAVTAKDSFFRKIFGDGITDIIVQAVNAGSAAVLGEAQLATEFALVNFTSQGVFDIFQFAGAAQAETREMRGSPTTVALDFAAIKNQPLLGWQANVVMQRRFAISFSLGSFEISRGALMPV